MENKIIDLKGSKYLIGDFPFADNGKITVINKGKTGCGGTTLVKETTDKIGGVTVCAMPSVSSVKSKEQQFIKDDKVVCLYGDKRYEATPNNGMTIFCTYDKLDGLRFKCNDVRLVIDEYHTILRDVNYRKVMDNVCKWINRFQSATLMSATEDKFLIEALNTLYGNVNLITYKWDYVNKVKLVDVKSVKKYLTGIIRKAETSDHNTYIMFNNVKAIQDLISSTGISDYHIICSKTHDKVIKRSEINEVNSNLKKINFITAAGFEGTDILDENGQIICVFDVATPSTVFDWQTIIQMNGRCRDSKLTPIIAYHRGKLRDEHYIETKDRYGMIQYKKQMMEKLTLHELIDDEYYYIVNGKYVINPVMESSISRKLDALNNGQTIELFKKYLTDNNISVTIEKDNTSIDERKGHTQKSFKQVCKMYENGDDISQYRDYKLINYAYKELGVEKIEGLGYSKNNIKRALEKPTSMINVKVGKRYTATQLSRMINAFNVANGTDYPTNIEKVGQVVSKLGFIYDTKRLKNNKTGKQETYYIFISDNNFELSNTNKTVDVSENASNVTPNSYKDVVLSNLHFVTNSTQLVIDFDYTDGGSTVYSIPFENSGLHFAQGTKGGKTPNRMTTVEASQVNTNYYESKDDNVLFSECFNMSNTSYLRREVSYECTESLMFDIDDGMSVDEFIEYSKNNLNDVHFYWYKSHSYTEEHNKFRIIIPLSDTINFTKFGDEDSQERGGTYCTRAYKAFKRYLMPNLQDDNCHLGFFTPEGDVYEAGNPFVKFNAEYVKEYMKYYISNAMSDEFDELLVVPVGEKKTKAYKVTTNNVDGLANYINNNCTDGDRDNKCYWVACTIQSYDDGLEILNKIIDRKNYDKFKEKLNYRYAG